MEVGRCLGFIKSVEERYIRVAPVHWFTENDNTLETLNIHDVHIEEQRPKLKIQTVDGLKVKHPEFFL